MYTTTFTVQKLPCAVIPDEIGVAHLCRPMELQLDSRGRLLDILPASVLPQLKQHQIPHQQTQSSQVQLTDPCSPLPAEHVDALLDIGAQLPIWCKHPQHARDAELTDLLNKNNSFCCASPTVAIVGPQMCGKVVRQQCIRYPSRCGVIATCQPVPLHTGSVLCSSQ